MTQIITGSATPQDAKTYRLLPVEIPDSTSRITVRYQFGEEIGQGSGIIDIGIFDPRGSEFLGEGFRGWSGSARREFVITPTDATPGYMPGPIQPGTWEVCLGLYEIDVDGCGYRVEIEIESGETQHTDFPSLLLLQTEPRPARRHANGWYRGELHCHTFNSDGDSDPLDLIRAAEALELDFLAITDHNVLTQQIKMRDVQTDLILIPGMEVTTYHGHWNIWGDAGWLDFRVHNADELRRSMTEAIRRGYLVSCNHPRPHGPEWEYPEVDTFHCIEVWNGPWFVFNDAALAVWEAHLRAGRRYTAVGGSDTHFLSRDHIARLGHPTTFIHCDADPSAAELLSNLRAGHAFVTESPQGPQLYLQIGDAIMGDTVQISSTITLCELHILDGKESLLQLYGSQGLISEQPIDNDDWQQTIPLDLTNEKYVRAQLVDKIVSGYTVRALTNPIYLTEPHTQDS